VTLDPPLLDVEITTRAMSRDGAAFVELMRRHRRLVYAAVYSAAGATPHADDIAQEVVTAAWRGIDKVRAPTAVPSWLWVIATRCALRWEQAHPNHDPLDPVRPEHAPAVPDGTTGVADRLVLGRALAQLPERERAVVTMHLIADMSYREIAETIGCALGTVQSRYGRGIARLRVLLGEGGDQP
jgi:RNA polymerase sigma-70 factor (ECF subfamily)